MDSILRDIRFGGKLLWKDKAFAATTALTLAITIGANTAVFTVVYSVLLRPLPVPEANRVVLMSNQYPRADTGESRWSGVPDYFDRLRFVPALEEQALIDLTGETIEINSTAERVRGMAVTPSFFRLARVAPALGRTFHDEDAEIGREQKVILSYGLWQQLYGGDPSVLGRELRLSGQPHTIVGVMSPGFQFADPDVRFWTPLAFTDDEKSDEARHSNNYLNVGRMRPGVTIAQVQAQVDALNATNMERFPQWKEILTNAGFHTRVEPLLDTLVRTVRGTLYLLWGGAIFVLLIGVVNLANLALARSSVRLRELGTRMALGAGRLPVSRQLAIEGTIIALIGGLAGLVLGWAALQTLSTTMLDRLPRMGEVRVDGTVVLLTLATAVIVGIVIALMPIVRVARLDLTTVLHEEGRGGTSGRGARLLRQTLVVSQVAFAFMLLTGASLLLASFRHLLAVDPGFRADGVLTATTSAPSSDANAEQRAVELRTLMERALEAVRRLPGIAAAGATNTIPFGGDYSNSVIIAEGYVMAPGESLISPRQIVVTPGYFETMGIALRRGRYFDARDSADGASAVIVDERLARKFWPERDPIGRRMYLPTDPDNALATNEQTRWLTVVGVVGEVRLEDLAGSGNQAGAYYLPYAQSPPRTMTFAVRAAGERPVVMQDLRAALRQVDPALPLFDVRTMVERTEQSLVPRRTPMVLALGFAVMALLLSAIGVYGVLAYLVAQRTREIGIRIALGSTARRIFRLVIKEGVVLIVAGVALGLTGAFALRRALESQLYGVGPSDPLVIASAILLLAVVGVIASSLPARLAAKVDPASILNA